MSREKMINPSMFILRVVLGTIFIAHGAQRLFGMFGGIGIEGTAKLVEGLGLPNPALVAVIWASIEFIGGLFLLFGILARWAAVVIAIVMLIVTYKINLPYGFFIQRGGIEYDLLILGSCVPLILIGGGSWSVWDV